MGVAYVFAVRGRDKRDEDANSQNQSFANAGKQHNYNYVYLDPNKIPYPVSGRDKTPRGERITRPLSAASRVDQLAPESYPGFRISFQLILIHKSFTLVAELCLELPLASLPLSANRNYLRAFER